MLRRNGTGFVFLVLVSLFGACSGNRSGSTVTECFIPEDQSGTIRGQWAVTPVPVAFSSSAGFSESERGAFTAAATSWNDHFGAARNLSVMEVSGDSGRAKPTSVCAQGILNGSSFSDSVVIYKNANWPANQQDVIALTVQCPFESGESPYAQFTNAFIDLNYTHFFVAGTNIPDFESIALHEFGHLIGLDHSCGFPGMNGMPDCGNANAAYTEAVMFPAVLFGSGGVGQARRTLQENDKQRANCLYGEQPT